MQSRLYLNQGNLKFKDITAASGFAATGRNTGVSIADLNADGLPDIYLSTGGLDCEGDCKNQLFIHLGNDENGIPQFAERAAAYGLTDGLYTQQAAFFDYDNDGDLDAYLLRNVIDNRDKNAPSGKQFIDAKSKDVLLENRYADSLGHPVFIDVSAAAGITERGYGLGITINDFNDDSYPDIYVANDFLSEDLLYISRVGKGQKIRYENQNKTALKHQSYNAMGVDAADINADGLPDIVVLDMLPENNERRKTMLGFMNYNKYELSQRQGYAPQFIRNTLQLNSGSFIDQIPFQEVGYLAGISATDWSWTPLLADFDNDGDRDLYVTNGYGKDVTDLDFINYSAESNAFGSKAELMKKMYADIQKMPNIDIPNYYFEKTDALKFTDKSEAATEQIPSISNGAIYVDLDNDGDLDIVSNNIDSPVFLLKNTTDGAGNFLKVKFKTDEKQPSAIGLTVTLYAGENVQKQYNSPVRGYLSSVPQILHFGLGKIQKIDSVRVDFPGRKSEIILRDVSINQTLEIDLAAADKTIFRDFSFPECIFKQVTPFAFTHRENQFQDYDAQPLLLRQNSRQGPCLAAANIDGKPGDELYIGGAKDIAGRLYRQTANGDWTYTEMPDAASEDTDAAFFDADADGDLDLYVVSGGSEFIPDSPLLHDRLYLNDGAGNFTKDTTFPEINTSGTCVATFTADTEKPLIFVGSSFIPRNFPVLPENRLLVFENESYKLKTAEYRKNLASVGRITDAVAVDFTQNGVPDLAAVGHWMSPVFHSQFKNRLQQEPVVFQDENGEKTDLHGLWNCIESTDLDGDGDLDFILGNQGENTRLTASAAEPLTLYTGDYDNNGSPDPLVGMYYPDRSGSRKLYPLHARDDVVKQLVKVKSRYRTYADFGNAAFKEILADADPADFAEVTTLQSVWLENTGQNTFTVHPLPTAAQFAPINAILADDFDNDGNIDLLLTGNDYGAESNGGRADAFNGLHLRGDGQGNLTPVPLFISGFYVPGDGRDLILLRDKDGKRLILAGQNGGELRGFEVGRLRG